MYNIILYSNVYLSIYFIYILNKSKIKIKYNNEIYNIKIQYKINKKFYLIHYFIKIIIKYRLKIKKINIYIHSLYREFKNKIYITFPFKIINKYINYTILYYFIRDLFTGHFYYLYYMSYLTSNVPSSTSTIFI